MFSEPPGTVSVPWEAALQALKDLAAFVASEARKRELSQAYPWATEDDPLGSRAVWKASDALRLLAPSLAQNRLDDLALRLHLNGSQVGESAAVLALRDLSPRSETLDRLVELEDSSRRGSASALLQARDSFREARGLPSPEAAGYDAARALRRLLGNADAPLDDDALLSLLRDCLGTTVVEVPTADPSNDADAAIGARRDGGACLLL